MDANPLPAKTRRLLDQEKFRNAAQAAGLQRVVFLAGPFIKTSKSPRKNTKNSAALLRYRLYHALDNEGWVVTLGEYERLIEAADPLLGDLNNAALAEIKHARSDETDAVVILPSSPGSFLELGAFSNIEAICKKMLVIVDERYKDDQNYMNLGPVKAAVSNKAEVFFIDYADFNECWSVVEQFVTTQARRKAVRGVVAP